MKYETNESGKNFQHRRAFVKKEMLITLTGVVGAHLLPGRKSEEEEGQKVAPPEDLMQEHGLLNRLLLIYDIEKQLGIYELSQFTPVAEQDLTL